MTSPFIFKSTRGLKIEFSIRRAASIVLPLWNVDLRIVNLSPKKKRIGSCPFAGGKKKTREQKGFVTHSTTRVLSLPREGTLVTAGHVSARF